jgi:NTE family protein
MTVDAAIGPSQPARALVLGAGGPVGRAWESGLVSGLIGQGVSLRTADAIIGTSAGAIAGAHLALGLEPSLPVVSPTQAAAASSPSSALVELWGAMVRASQSSTPEIERQEIGRLALRAATMSEEQSIQRVGALAKRDWPANFRVTAVNVRTGEGIVWGRGSGVPLERAVAASCALPGVWPPIAIEGERYMDGGIRSMLNADLASGYGAVVVVSCFALFLPEGVGSAYQRMLNAGLEAEIAALRRSAAFVDVITPCAEFLELTQGGIRMLDAGLSPEAQAIGAQQAIQEAPRLPALWRQA